MNPHLLMNLALLSYALAGIWAGMSLRWEGLRKIPLLPLGTVLGMLAQTAGMGWHCADEEPHFLPA